MTVDDDQATVIGLACEMQARTNAEQGALLRVARSVDNERNTNSSGNVRMWGPDAGSVHAIRGLDRSDVESTRVLEPENGDREVHLAARKRVPGGPAKKGERAE